MGEALITDIAFGGVCITVLTVSDASLTLATIKHETIIAYFACCLVSVILQLAIKLPTFSHVLLT